MSLPTYAEAVCAVEGLNSGSKTATSLRLIAQYLDGQSLARASRVNKEWYEAFSRQLWNDFSKYIAETPNPFTRTNTFMLQCKRTREYTRRKVSALDWGRLLQFRDKYNNDWHKWDHMICGVGAFSIMRLFPNLKFAILDDLKGFDEEALPQHTRELHELALGSRKAIEELLRPPLANYLDSVNTTTGLFELVLFSAARCYDLDASKSLQSVSMTNLWYLDISYTTGGEDWFRRFGNARLTNLRVLKLQGLRLIDSHFVAIKTWLTVSDKIWSLDLSHNSFTDAIILRLFDHFLRRLPPRVPDSCDPNALSLNYEDTPFYVPVNNNQNLLDDSIALLRPDSKYSFMRYMEKYGHFSTPNAPVLAEHDPLARSTGITHLYLSNNKFTSAGIRLLMNETNRLQVLDVGSVRGERNLMSGCWTFAQVDSINPLLSTSGSRLEKLRIHHSIVTHTPTALYMSTNTETKDPRQTKASERVGEQQSLRWAAFNPKDNHRITDLTLTGVPTRSYGYLIKKLIGFLNQCADQEEHIMRLKASEGPQTRYSPRLLSGLRTLTLEFMPRSVSRAGSGSVSGDRDAEAFLTQSLQDFSFFGSNSRSEIDSLSQRPPSPSTPLLDVEAELRKFRATDEGCKWTGKVQIAYAGHSEQ